MTGRVVSVNRRLHYFTISDDASRRHIKIDVRHMRNNQTIDLRSLRHGERVSVAGGWENRDTFDALFIRR